ncbi:MAG TPA: hypothetical protein VFY72_08055, partial [Beijerinckiaceae bacterium]|nr:hypothetical protein [Beijerinckiaceae bacterium]
LDRERRARFEALAAEGRGGNAQNGTPGRVYVLGEDGAPEPVAVRLGVTDGSTTEIVAGDLRAGAGIVIGGGPRAQAGAEPAPTRPRGPRLF